MLLNLCTCIFKYLTEDPGLTFFSTIIGIVASVLLAKYIFETEQNTKKKEEQNLALNEIKILHTALKNITSSIFDQILLLNKYLNSKYTKLGKVRFLDLNILSIINLNRLYHYYQGNNAKLDEFSNIILTVKKLEELLKDLGNTVEEFQSKSYHLHNQINDLIIDCDIYFHEALKSKNITIENLTLENSNYDNEINFLYKYSEINNNLEILFTTNKNSKKKSFDFLYKNFIMPIIHLTANYTNLHSRVLSKKCHIIQSLIEELNFITDNHKKYIESGIDILEHVDNEIKKYIN